MNASDPSNYVPHRLGYACADCGVSSWIGVALKHSRICAIAPNRVALPSDQTEDPNASKAQRALNTEARREAAKEQRRPSLTHVAHEGVARLHYSDAEIVDAVNRGEISVSTAMNQDC